MAISGVTGQMAVDAAAQAAAAAATTTSATSVGSTTGATSPQYAVVYDLISEGEIHGLVNGAASVYLNGTPLTTEANKSSVSPIVSGNGTFTAASLTVSSNEVNLSGTSGRIILLERGGKISTAFTANAGDFRIRANGFFTANMAINPALLAAARPKLRITGMGAGGREYVGTVTQYIDANTAVVEPAISTSGINKAGGIDHIAIVNTATSNSLTVYVAPAVSGTKFQIFSAAVAQDQLYNDKWNFKNTAVNFRVGTLNQTPVTYADVPTASFLTSIEQALEWTNTFNGLQSPLSYSAAALGVSEASEIDKIRLGIEFPAGLYKNTGEKGKIRPAFVGFQIKFQYTQGGQIKTAIIVGPSSSTGIPSGKQKQDIWRNAISGYTGYYEAEVTSSFLHEIEIPVEQFKPFTNFSIIVSRLNPHNSDDYESADDTIINSTTLKYAECQVLDKFRYPHSAYAAITFPSEGFNSVPGRSYHVRGIKVQVPSNYTTREESFDGKAKYNGAWDGTFITRYTNNPAWIFYDLATNKRYGLGKYVDSSLVDKYSLYRIGRYCDELVPDGKGGLEPRFTCNVYIFEAEEAYKVLRDLATTFRGMMIWAQGALLAVQDSPKEPIYTFTQGNVVDGLFTYEYSGRLARYNEVNITWNNPDQFYQQDVLTVTDQTDIIKQGKVVSMNSVAFGCTSEGQAYRVALWNMLTSQLETEFISFGTGMNANFLLPGDIINVQDHHLNAIQASGRIRSASGNTVILDRNVTIASNTFNDRTSFVNSLVSSGTDGFNDLIGNTGSIAPSITRSSTNSASLGSYSYRANSTTGNLFIDSMDEYNASEYSLPKANTSNNVGLSTFSSRAGIILSTFSPAITSFGSNISVLTTKTTTSEDYNVNGKASYRTYSSEIPLNVNVSYTSGIVKSYNIRASKNTFFGVSSPVSTSIANISISFSDSALSTQEFITLDNIVLGNTSSAIQSTAHTLHVVFDGPGCYLQQSSAVISGTTYYRGDLIPGITTSIAATNLLDDSGNIVTTVFSEHTHVQKRSIVTPEPYVGNIIELSSAFTSTPNTESIWALENATYDNEVAPKKYRVLNIKEEQGGVYSVVASNYAEQKFDELEAKVQIRDNTFIGPRPGEDIPNVGDLTANYFRMDVNDEDNLSDSVLYAYVSWTPPVESFTDSNGSTSTRQYRYVDAYEIQHNFYDDINTSYRDFITETVSGSRNNLVIPTVRPGNYIVRVRTKNIFGQYSSWYSIEITFNRAAAAPGYDIFGIRAGGSLDSAVLFEANTFTVIDSQYTYVNPLGKVYTVNGATSAQTSQSFQSFAANSDYFLMWDNSDSVDPWKAIKYYTDTSIRTPYGVGNSYWSEAGIANSGLVQIPGTISATVGSRVVTGSGTYFASNLSVGNLIKLHNSSNTANSFYAIVSIISSNTSLTTREVIQKPFTNQTIRTPSLPIDFVNDTIFSKIAKNASNVASEEIRYAVTAVDEPQLLILDADSNGFRYTSAGGLIGPSAITLFANRQNLRANTDWYIYDANNNILANTLLSNKTDTSAQLNAVSFGSISNNNFVKVTSNVGSFSSSYTILKIVDGANGTFGRGAHTVLLVNENHSIPVDSAGLNGIYTASGTDILVWEANTPLTYNASATLVPSFNVAIINTANITANASPITITTAVANDTRRYGNHSNITANSAYIVYAIGVRDLLGNLTTYYKQQSFTATRNGTVGANGRGAHTVLLVNENHSIPLDASGLNGIYTASGTDILVWEANTPLTYNASATLVPSFNVAVVSSANITANASPITVTTAVTNDTRRYGNHSNINANTASIVYNIGVRDTLGNLTTYTRQQSFTGIRSGATGAAGANGANGEPAVSLSLSRAGITLFAYAEGTIASYSGASGQASLYRGDVNITESTTWSSTTTSGLTGSVLNTSGSKGQYSVTNLATANDTGTLTIYADYAGKTYTSEFSVAKAKGGYEIVGALPSTNLFEGRVVFLTGEDILYRYTGTAWTAAVPAANITGQLVEAQLALSSVNTAQLVANAVTQVKMAINSVNTAQLVSNAVTEVKMALNSVNTSAIVQSAITEAKMALNSVNTSAILTSAITEAKMALNSVNTSAILISAITEAKLAQNSVNTAALVANAITQVKIATNAVGTAQVQVDAITIPKLAIAAPGSALNADPGMQDSTGWVLINGANATFTTTGDGKVGNYVARSANAGGVTPMTWMNEIKRIPVDADKTYRVRAWMRTVNGAGNTAYMGVALFSNTGTNITGDGSQWYYAAAGITPPAAWTEYIGTFGANTAKTFPSNARTMSPLFILSYPGNSNVVHEIQDLRIEEIIPSTLIRDDSITTPKLTANSITAAKISANAIETYHLTANSVVAEKIAANSITTIQLAANAVIAENISANSVVAEKIAANSITTIQLAASSVIAENIAAKAITTSKLLITGSGAALNPDPMGEDIEAWPGGIQLSGITDGPAGNTAIGNQVGSAAEVRTAELIPIEPNKPYRLEMWAKQTAGTVGQGVGYLGVAWYRSNSALMISNLDSANGGANSPSGWNNGYFSYYGIMGTAFPSSWTEYSIGFGSGETAAIPTEARYIRLLGLLNWNSTAGIQHAITNIRLMEKSDATLITDGAIITSKLAANSVVAEKIAANSVVAEKIAANSITTIQLAANAVIAENISANSVVSEKIAANSITAIQIAANSVIAEKIAANSITAIQLAANSVLADKIAANSVIAEKIAANSITTIQLAANAVLAENISANSVIAEKIAANSINALQLAANAVFAYHVTANAITAEAIAANSIIAEKIAANSITTNKINAGAITAAKISATEAVITGTIQIANGIINNAKILDLSADKLNAGSINVAQVNIRGTSTTGLSINSASSGERLEMSTTTIRIFDSSGVLRVKIGNLA